MTKKITAPVEEKDFILSFITSTLDFCKQNKKGVLTALGILVLAAVIGFAYSTHVKNVTEKDSISFSLFFIRLSSSNASADNEGFESQLLYATL